MAAAEAHWSAIVDKVQIRKYLTWGYSRDPLRGSRALPASGGTLSLLSLAFRTAEHRLQGLRHPLRGRHCLCGKVRQYHEPHHPGHMAGRGIYLPSRTTPAGRGDDIPICAACPDRQYRSWRYNYWKVLEDAESKEKDRGAVPGKSKGGAVAGASWSSVFCNRVTFPGWGFSSNSTAATSS